MDNNDCSQGKHAVIQAEIYDVRFKKNGSGRIQLDFGADSAKEITKLQSMILGGETLFQVALVPIPALRISTGSEDYEPDPFTGEIPL